jgi:hypothetical protein
VDHPQLAFGVEIGVERKAYALRRSHERTTRFIILIK